MKNPKCSKCGETMSRYYIGIVTRYKCRHCPEDKEKKDVDDALKAIERFDIR